MFLVLIVKQKINMHQLATKCLQIRNTYGYDCLHSVENTHIVTYTVLKEGYIMGYNLVSAAKM